MISLESFKKAFEEMPDYIKEAEVNGETHNVIELTASDHQIVDYQVKNFTELYIRVAGEKNGYVYTQNLQEDPKELLKKAYLNSSASDKEALEEMNRENKQVVYSNTEAISEVSLLSNKTLAIEKELLDKIQDEKVSLEVCLHAETYGQNTVNSYGFSAMNYIPLYILTVAARKNGAVALLDQSKNDMDQFDLDYFAKNLSQRLAWQENQSGGFVSGEYPVVFSQEATYNLLATAWQEFAGHKYLEKGSIYAGKLNETIVADCLSFSDETTIDNSGFEFNCDSEGSYGRGSKIVENGKLVGLLTNTTTAKALGLDNSGNAGRRPLLFGNIATDILVTPKNFCLTPSNKSLEDLIKNMNNGILITEYFDIFHSLNIASGNFSVPCYGVLIENGKMVKNLKALTMSGNLKDLFENAIEVGDDFIVRPMNYLNNYGIGACCVRFSKVTISGE